MTCKASKILFIISYAGKKKTQISIGIIPLFIAPYLASECWLNLLPLFEAQGK